MNWYEISTKKLLKQNLKSTDYKHALSEALDMKYGNYDYDKDLRKNCFEDLNRILSKELKNLELYNSLLCGTTPYEIKMLGVFNHNKSSLAVIDMSQEVLRNLSMEIPDICCKVWSSLDNLPFPDKSFDYYFAFRSITSATINLDTAVKEALRVSRKGVFVSVPNGYIDGSNKIIKGMYSPSKNKLDKNLPYKIVEKIIDIAKEFNHSEIKTVEIESEIIILIKL